MSAVEDPPRWLEVAAAEIGVARFPPGRSNPRITEYHAGTHIRGYDDKASWCSSFVDWCLTRAGVRGTGSALARSWLDWGRPLAAPRPGCIAVLYRDDPASWKGHVGFWLRSDEQHAHLLGGNQLGAVREHTYPLASVLGYRWPALAVDPFRPGRAEDATPIAALIRRLAHHATVDPAGVGAENFFASISEAAEAGYLANPRHDYLVATSGEALAGLIAMRDLGHLFHLFVAPEFRGDGLATRLWDAAVARSRAAGHAGGFTVNATRFALPVYRRFGFVERGEPKVLDGIRFFPMATE